MIQQPRSGKCGQNSDSCTNARGGKKPDRLRPPLRWLPGVGPPGCVPPIAAGDETIGVMKCLRRF
jgi:hypothetical protein